MKDFWSKLKKISKNEKTISVLEKVLIALMIIIPIFFAVWFRAYSAYLPITEDWAENNVHSYYKNQIATSVNAQFPNLPDTRKTELVEQQYAMFLETNGDQVKTQITDNADYIRSKFQDVDGKTYLLEIDPYHYYRYIRNYFESGVYYDELKDGKEWDTHKVFPIGSPVKMDFHVWFGIFSYKLASLFGNFNLMHIFFLLPLFIAPLAVLPAFFIARKVGGNVAGFFAGMLVAIHSAFISRTPAGFTDTDSYNVVFPLFITWFFLESLYAKTLKMKIFFASLSALFVGIFYTAWGGWWYSFVIILATIIAYFAYESLKNIKKHSTVITPEMKKNLIGSGVFFALSAVFLTIFSGSISTITSFVTGPLSFLLLKDVGGTKIWPNVFTTVAELNPGTIPTIISSMYGKLFFFIALVGIALSLLHNNLKAGDDKHYKKKRSISLGLLIFSVVWYFGLVFMFQNIPQLIFLVLMTIPAVVIFIMDLINNLEIDSRYALLLIIWFVAVMFATTKAIRFTLVLVPAFSIAFGIAVGISLKLLSNYSEKELGVNKALSTGILFILSLFLLNTPMSMADQISKSQMPLINDDWYEALDEINQKADKFAVINSWWDYGHWFKTIGNRSVTFDGGTQNSPQAHWIGHVLLTDNEQEALGILRMLDCGANNAFDNLNKIIEDELDAKTLLDKIILVDSRSDAEAILRENLKSISDEELNSVLDNTHCDNLPEDYFITSDDMIGKSGVWAHFGAWNFTKATMVNIVKANANKKDTSVSALMSRFGFEESVAEDYYYQIIGNNADQWIADWPSYVSQYSTCSQQKDLLVCQNGLAFNITSQEPFLMTQQGKVKPTSLSFMDSNGEFQTVRYDGNVVPYSAALIQTSSGTKSILMVPELAGSMFTRMYFFNDQTLEHFNLFSKRTQITGGDVLVWKVDWNGKSEDDGDENMVENNNPIVLMKTNMGEIELELFEKDAPITVQNFLNLSKKGFYDNVKFHRIIKNFMIQTGDPNSKGNDTSSYGIGGPGYTIKDESNSYTFSKSGMLAMANTGRANTGGSQFFITVAPTTWLNGKHTIFGKVVKGYDLVERISNVTVNGNDLPLSPIIIESITLK